MSKQDSMNIVLNYIFEHELDDFLDNPSKDHVFYHAIAAVYGEDQANRELTLARLNHE